VPWPAVTALSSPTRTARVIWTARRHRGQCFGPPPPGCHRGRHAPAGDAGPHLQPVRHRTGVALAEELVALLGADNQARVFFCNSGTEANEVAFKLSRLTGRTKLVAAQEGFHGRTMGSLALTGQPPSRHRLSRCRATSRTCLTATPMRWRPRWTMRPRQCSWNRSWGKACHRAPEGYLAAARTYRAARRLAGSRRSTDGNGPHRNLFRHQHDGITRTW